MEKDLTSAIKRAIRICLYETLEYAPLEAITNPIIKKNLRKSREDSKNCPWFAVDILFSHPEAQEEIEKEIDRIFSETMFIESKPDVTCAVYSGGGSQENFHITIHNLCSDFFHDAQRKPLDTPDDGD